MRTLTTRQQQAQREGRMAAHMGRPRTDNPYHRNDRFNRHRLWDDEWADTNARADDQAYKDSSL